MTIGVDILIDHSEGIGTACLNLVEVPQVFLQVLWVGHLRPGLLPKRVGVIAQELTQRVVDLQDATFRIKQAHADGRVVHRPAKTFIGYGLPAAGILRRLLRGHFLVDQMGRDDRAVAVSLGIAKRLDVHVEPVHDTIDRSHLRALTDDPARIDRLPSVDVSLRILRWNEFQQCSAQPMLWRGTQNVLNVR